ncbi:MAG: extracellular solute-binding protein [Propionibacteriaceae bacterium]|jgi:raffinose/stachyose/melibiose transport system substrate-binding protein|nr:extracellular solute-binding protein [Propionibacteriaceae bacterium]
MKNKVKLAVLVGLAASLAACSAPGAGNTPSQTDTAPGAVVTDAASMGDVTLTLWDSEVLSGQSAQFTELLEGFQAKYTNITIDRVAQGFTDMKVTLPMALSDENPPDVVQANNGRNDMGAFVAAGQLTDLQPYADAYGWIDRYPETVLKNSMYTADGKTFGEGNLYGLSQMGELVGIYYNKEKLAALGLETPATWDDFVSALAAAKAAGETPIMHGDSEGWPAGQLLGLLLGQTAPADQLITLGMGNPGSSWNKPDTLAGVTLLDDWIKAGYFNDGVNGLTDEAVATQFAEGTGVFYIAGSWQVNLLQGIAGDKLGFIAPPSSSAGTVGNTLGGASQPYAIPVKAQHKDAAALFIDYITSPEAMQVLVDTGNIPVYDAESLVTGDDLLAQASTAFGEVTTQGQLLPYLDWSTPTFGEDAMTPRLQDLFAQKISPQGVIDAFESNYADSAGA